MRVHEVVATSPSDGRYAELIRNACQSVAVSNSRIAIAYATQSGVAVLCSVLAGVPRWQGAQKKWLVGIDFCRSDPLALAHLANLPRSEVRIYDGEFVCQRAGCAPRVSFHPKLYLFGSRTEQASVVGSGNLSQTGLRIGIEAGASIIHADADESRSLVRWYSSLWGQASPLATVLSAYAQRYAARENKRQSSPVEDDAAPATAGQRGQLTPEQLRRLRVCDRLWIEAGNLHLNRGPGRPGNQLMLKRNTRVFFGFQATDVPRDTAIGVVAIRWNGTEQDECSLRFSNNAMDVLTLPIPGEGAPASYDRQVIMFQRIGVRRFRLAIARSNQVAGWKRQSEQVHGRFRMSSGREWGVF